MYSAVRALVFGEDFSSDPVSRTLGLLLAFCSHGRITFSTHMFSQVTACSLPGALEHVTQP